MGVQNIILTQEREEFLEDQFVMEIMRKLKEQQENSLQEGGLFRTQPISTQPPNALSLPPIVRRVFFLVVVFLLCYYGKCDGCRKTIGMAPMKPSSSTEVHPVDIEAQQLNVQNPQAESLLVR